MTGRVLVVGHVCIDIINYVRFFPEEDTDVGSASNQEALGGAGNRCLDQQWQRGGNASNTATVLSLLGASSEFLGSIPEGTLCRFLEDDFAEDGVGIGHCPRFPAATPISCVIVCESGSRTIIHSNRDLPEVPAQTARRLPLAQYDWVHFEGRNIRNVKEMIAHIREERTRLNHKLTISVELEKPHRQELEALFELGDVIFVSKDYAKAHGYSDMEAAVRGLKERTPAGSVLICPWGEVGAAACLPDGTVATSPAHSPAAVVDTLGAGDTFIGAAIWRLRLGDDVSTVLKTACQVAGIKVGLKGFRGLPESLKEAQLLKQSEVSQV